MFAVQTFHIPEVEVLLVSITQSLKETQDTFVIESCRSISQKYFKVTVGGKCALVLLDIM